MAWSINQDKTIDFTTQMQYANTNIHELLQAIANVRYNYIYQGVECFRTDCRNLYTANGGALDMWGRVLGFARYLPIADDSNRDYKEWNFNEKYFNQLQFGRLSADDFVTLPDFEYRFILLMILMGRNIEIKIANLQAMAKELFATIGIVCNVFDTQDMSGIRYVIQSEAPAWLSYVCENFDILPRPAGIKASLIVDLVKPIGFYIDENTEANQNITNYYYGNFES